jgi:adenine-specific DNA methylase
MALDPEIGGLTPPYIQRKSAALPLPKADLILTDPPYYDAIPYSDLMDWFYVWLRRTVWDLSPVFQEAMLPLVAPKWDAAQRDGELIDDESRHGGNAELSKKIYEDKMASGSPIFI